MPGARTATRPAAAPAERSTSTSARTTRARRTPAATSADADQLAGDLDRVLQLSQTQAKVAPKEPTRSAAATKRAVSATTSKPTARTVSAPKSEPKPTTSTTRTAPARPAVRSARAASGSASVPTTSSASAPSRVPSTTRPRVASTASAVSASSKAKGKGVTKPEPLKLPWMEHGTMSARDRVQAAQKSCTESLASLQEALRSGFKYCASPSPLSSAWTPERADEVIAGGRAGVAVLRELYGSSSATAQKIAVERGALHLMFRCVTLEMHDTARHMLEEAKPHLIRLYEHGQVDGIATSSHSSDFAVLPVPTGDVDEAMRTLLCTFGLAVWCCVLADDDLDPKTVPRLIPLSSDHNPLSPFLLAPTLPQTAVGPLSVVLYRRISTIANTMPSGTPEWLHARYIIAFATAMSATAAVGDGQKANSPDRVWASVERTAEKYLDKQDAEAARYAVAAFISRVVEVVEQICACRGEERSAWFAGDWAGVADMWTGLGRNLGDSAIIDAALAAMTATATISGPSKSSSIKSSGSSTPISVAPSPNVRSGASTPKTPTLPVDKIDNASAEVSKLCAKLAKMHVEVENLSKSDSAGSDELHKVLTTVNFDTLLVAVCSLDDSEQSDTLVKAALRSIERPRRTAIKMLDRAAYAPYLTRWLNDIVSFAERIVSNSSGERATTCSREIMPGVVDSTLHLVKHWEPTTGPGVVHELLERVYGVLTSCDADLDAGMYTSYANLLAQSAHSAAVRLTRCNAVSEGIPLARATCEWSSALLARALPAEAVQGPAWRATEAALAKRFELLAYCLQGSDKVGAVKAYCQSLASLPTATASQISVGAASTPLNTVFAGLADFTTTLKRATTLIASEESATDDFGSQLWAEMDRPNISLDVRAAMVERLVDGIEHAQFRPHVQVTMIGLCDKLLGVYGEAYPVRRMRVLLRLMSLITATGAAGDRFGCLGEEVDALAHFKDLGHDAGLGPYRAEYHASSLVLRALNTYHTEPEPSAAVAELGRAALVTIRNLVLPPVSKAKFPAVAGKRTVSGTRSVSGGKVPLRAARTTTKAAPVKTPVRRGAAKAEPEGEPAPTQLVADDLDRVSQLLSSLVSLLGVLGHVLPKLEALKVLRLLQRTGEGMADDHVQTSSALAAEYARVGKFSRASHMFAQAIKYASEADPAVSFPTRAVLHLRYSRFLAMTGHIKHAREEYAEAVMIGKEVPTPTNAGSYASRWISLCEVHERVALAHAAYAAIKLAESDITSAIASLTIAYKEWCRVAHGVSNLAAPAAKEPAPEAELEAPTETTTPDQAKAKAAFCLNDKHLSGLQWRYAESLFDATFDLSSILAVQGSVKECEYYLSQARGMGPSVRSVSLEVRIASNTAELATRRLQFEESAASLQRAAERLTVTDGPDGVELKRLAGELYARQDDAGEADDQYTTAINEIVGLDAEFDSSEARMVSTRKESIVTSVSKEPLLPATLGHILRQRAWLLREAGEVEEYENVLAQLEMVPSAAGGQAEHLHLQARVAMHEAFSHFKTDLFMSSLTESTIAMTMGSPDKRTKEQRKSTRHTAIVMLERASQGFQATLQAAARTGKIENVRQACVSLAVLGAFQTSLGHGSPTTTASAAGILASSSALTLHRELISAIDTKFPNLDADDMDWPTLEAQTVPLDADDALETYWGSVRELHTSADFLHTEYDLSSVPPEWAVVSVTVTDDRNTMLVSRHQNGHDPLVFCIPLDRQGRREGDDESELFTFDAGIAEMKAVMDGNEASIKSIKECKNIDDRKAWWRERLALDARLGELLATIEFCWLGAFKTVLNPRPTIPEEAMLAFRERLDRIFAAALTSAGSELKRGPRVRLNDELLACFATLSCKCRDEEIEDLVYFVLDLYQFHGIAVALAELDFDVIGVDVKSALSDLEMASGRDSTEESNEHLLLALDKNVQGIPWESIPILRGRAVSRIPSLPFLLDQVALGRHLSPPADGDDHAHRTVDATRTRAFLNPGGDLVGTQSRFEPRLQQLEKRGWTSITGRKPSESEVLSALRDSELVMYFGHGGAEEYVRGPKIRALPRCAVTMLWGCSSGLLRSQGDLDRTGTPNDYILAGCPCLVANLWDVTDKDIDRLTEVVMDHLGLDEQRVGDKSAMSVVQAVSRARTMAKLQYLTGAAPVVYGVPVYMA